MSRSYKKFPCWSAPSSDNGIHSGVHHGKKFANRKARRRWHWDIPSGNAYRRLTDPWDIRDYKSVYYSKREVDNHIKEAIHDYLGKDIPEHRTRYHSFRNLEYYRKYTLRYYYYAK